MFDQQNATSIKKILFVAPSAYLLGGVQTWLDYLLPGLAARNWLPVLGLVSGSLHDARRYASEHPWNNSVFIENPTGSRSGRVRALARLLYREAPDVVVGVNIADLYDAYLSLPRSKQSSMRLVMSLHGLEKELCSEVGRIKDTCDGIVCTNRLAAKVLTDIIGVKQERVFYAPYGVQRHELEKREESTSLQILFAGRLEQTQKRIMDLPSLVEHLKLRGVPFTLTIAGKGPDEELLANSMKAFCDEGCVRFVGHIHREELLEYWLKKASAFLVTSAWETGPISIWESMANSVPVVTSQYVGSGLEGALLDHSNCLIFPVGDMKAAAERLTELREIKGLAEHLVEEAHALVSARYTEESSVASWSSCIESIFRSPPLLSRWLNAPRQNSEGYLSTILGAKFADFLRPLVKKRRQPVCPGDEWPHIGHATYSTVVSFESLELLDRGHRLHQSYCSI